MQALSRSLQTPLRHGDAKRWIMSSQSLCKRVDPLRRNTQPSHRSCFKPKTQLIDALIAATDSIAQTHKHRLRRKLRVTLTGMHQMKTPGTVNTTLKRMDALFDAVLCGSDELRCGRGRRRTKIGDKIRNRKICLVPNR
jgi:hypothetical protein